MTWLEFLAALAKAVAWPGVTASALWVFRKPVTRLIDRIREVAVGNNKLSASDLQASARDRGDVADAPVSKDVAMKEIVVTTATGEPLPSEADQPPYLPPDPHGWPAHWPNLVHDLVSLSLRYGDQPLAAGAQVYLAGVALDALAYELLRDLAFARGPRSPVGALEEVARNVVGDPDWSANIRQLQALRDVYDPQGENVDAEQAREFLALADRVQKHLLALRRLVHEMRVGNLPSAGEVTASGGDA